MYNNSNNNPSELGFGIGVMFVIAALTNKYWPSGDESPTVQASLDSGPEFLDTVSGVLYSLVYYCALVALIAAGLFILWQVIAHFHFKPFENLEGQVGKLQKKLKKVNSALDSYEAQSSYSARDLETRIKNHKVRLRNISKIVDYDSHMAAAKAKKDAPGDKGGNDGRG